MFGIGAPELLIVLLIVLILFGGTKLPELSRSLGSAIKEFKDGVTLGDEKKETKDKKRKSEDKNA